MSGGFFEYKQFYLKDIIDDIKEILENKNTSDFCFSDSVLDEFEKAILTIQKAYQYIEVIDMLVSGDYDEDEFIKEIRKINNV